MNTTLHRSTVCHIYHAVQPPRLKAVVFPRSDRQRERSIRLLYWPLNVGLHSPCRKHQRSAYSAVTVFVDLLSLLSSLLASVPEVQTMFAIAGAFIVMQSGVLVQLGPSNERVSRSWRHRRQPSTIGWELEATRHAEPTMDHRWTARRRRRRSLTA